MELRPRTTENDGDSLPTTGDATRSPRDPAAPAAPRTRALDTTQRTAWEPRTGHEDLLSLPFFGNFVTVLKYCLAYRASSRGARARQRVGLGLCTYETLQRRCADWALPPCLPSALSLRLTLNLTFLLELFHLKKQTKPLKKIIQNIPPKRHFHTSETARSCS